MVDLVDFKGVRFLGSSLKDLRGFPASARREAGFQLGNVQRGEEPDNWKSMDIVGPGVKEIRIQEQDGAFRVMYVAKFIDFVYVLHCFQKKTEKTGKMDIDLARKRYADLVKEVGA
jgi:phage-related protein